MSDLISRSALLRHKTYLWDPVLGHEACVCVDDIESAPTIDAVPVDKMVLYDLSINTKTRTAKAVFLFGDKKITLCRDCGELAPVVHGRWVEETERMGNYSHCSECGIRCQGYVPNYNYCPNCGAKMDGDVNG